MKLDAAIKGKKAAIIQYIILSSEALFMTLRSTIQETFSLIYIAVNRCKPSLRVGL